MVATALFGIRVLPRSISDNYNSLLNYSFSDLKYLLLLTTCYIWGAAGCNLSTKLHGSVQLFGLVLCNLCKLKYIILVGNTGRALSLERSTIMAQGSGS